MVWNYRIVKTKVDNIMIRYAIHEVYYSSEDTSLPVEELDRMGVSWTEEPIAPESFVMFGESDNPEEEKKHIHDTLLRMLCACNEPIINGLE